MLTSSQVLLCYALCHQCSLCFQVSHVIAEHPCLPSEWLLRQEPAVVTAGSGSCFPLLETQMIKHWNAFLLPFLKGHRYLVWCETPSAETLLNTGLLCRCKNVLLCRRHACVGTHNNYTIERRSRAAHCCFSLSHGNFSMSWMKRSRFLHFSFLPLVTFTT